jgi:hypothetical protein
MPERKPNYFARVLAMLALVGAFVLVIFILATTESSDSGDDGDDKTATEKGPTKKGENALEEGVWILRDGDTLTSISEQTGIDVEDLEELNPDIDPQTLAPGQRIVLIEGGGDPSSPDSTPGPDGTGVGDEGPTGSSSSSDDSSLSD